MCDWLHVEGSSKEHPRTLTSMSNLAMLLQAQGKLAEAEPLLLEALRACRATFGEEHPDTLTTTNNLAALSWRR